MGGEKTSPISRDRCAQISLCFALSHAFSKKRPAQLPSPSEAKSHRAPTTTALPWPGLASQWNFGHPTPHPRGAMISSQVSLQCLVAFQLPPLPTPFLGELPCKEKEKAKGGSFGECGVGLEKGWSYDK